MLYLLFIKCGAELYCTSKVVLLLPPPAEGQQAPHIQPFKAVEEDVQQQQEDKGQE